MSGGTIDSPIQPIQSTLLSDGSRLMVARVFVTFTVGYYTELRTMESVQAIDTTVSVPWLHLITFATQTMSVYKHDYLYVSYNTFLNPTVKSGAEGFDGRVLIGAGMVNLIPSALNINNQYINISTSQFYAQLNEILVTKAESVPFAQYSSVVEATGTTHVGVIDIAKPASTSASSFVGNQADGDVAVTIANGNLGVFRLPQTTPSLQQGAHTPIGEGTNVKQGFNLRLIPDIKLLKEGLTVRRQKLAVDTETGFLGISPAGIIPSLSTSVEEDTLPNRVIGWQTENYAIKHTYRAEFYLYATVSIKQLTDNKPDLKLPDSQINDYYWSSTLGDDTGRDLEIDTEDPLAKWGMNFWDDYKWIIIAAIAVAGFVLMWKIGIFDLIRNSILSKSNSRG